jgi:hypothetical protein
MSRRPYPERRWIKLVASTLDDATFVRLAEIAGDVLSWEWEPSQRAIEFDAYVRPAWPVLCDELEYEKEIRDEAFADATWILPCPMRLDRAAALRLAEIDRRRELREARATLQAALSDPCGSSVERKRRTG